jgi:hypothetical protein
MTFHAPQIIYVFLLGIAITMGILNHGKPKEVTESFWPILIGIVIQVLLMWWGGFFGGK